MLPVKDEIVLEVESYLRKYHSEGLTEGEVYACLQAVDAYLVVDRECKVWTSASLILLSGVSGFILGGLVFLSRWWA